MATFGIRHVDNNAVIWKCMVQFNNKRPRTEDLDWIQENFKDVKLRVLKYVDYGIELFEMNDKDRRTVLDRFEERYDSIGTPNPLTKSALILKAGILRCGYDTTNKTITRIYNLAPNVLTYKKLAVDILLN